MCESSTTRNGSGRLFHQFHIDETSGKQICVHCHRPYSDQLASKSCEPTDARKIYVASSWRNAERHEEVVAVLRSCGHEVYNFREPRPGVGGFSWSQIDPEWESWTPEQYREALRHPLAEAGFRHDRYALDWADTGVLVMPCGRSAHLELGYLAGQGKPCAVITHEQMEPELMVKLCSGGVLIGHDELIEWAGSIGGGVC